jgi:DNA polymerase-3 subunit alpha
MTMTDTTINFAHLHVHTQYSLLDGAIRIDRLIARAREFGMDSVAITDHGTMHGVLDFYQQAHKAGIKPIIGCECYVAPRRLTDKTPLDHQGTTHLVLLAENMQGYQNLCHMLSVAQIQGFYYKPRIDKELLQAHHQGLIGLSACLHGEIPSLIKQEKLEQAAQAAVWYQKLFGERHFFMEVQNNGIPIQEKVNQALKDIGQRQSIPLVASNDCHYLNAGDVRAHGVLLCIQTGKTIHDSDRFKFSTDQLYFKSKQEMADSFGEYPGALDNTVDIAARCDVSFDFNTYHFPKFGTNGDVDEAAEFERQVREGYDNIIKRLKKRQPDLDEPTYRQRIDYEIKIITEMGFTGYFLIVADFIQYAKSNDIPVGPGRGSAAGSLVAYCLGITDLDPISNGLIFERFLNPSRKSMPDIDVDFCINGREDVFKYVVDRYGGGDYVAQIITFGKLKTRAVIRDVGRALDIPLKEVDAIAKMVPDVLNISLDDALQQEPRLQALADEKREIGDLIDICRVLEGLPRHASTHAAGVVIGDRPLMNYLPLYRGKNEEIVTQFDMKCVEKIGLVKFDFLGLRNLTVIANALEQIEAQGQTPPDLANLDFEDRETFQLLSAGDTTGVFQLESSGMKDLLVRMKPECFDDVIALVALYRPGPLDSGMVDDFVERKHGRKKVEYLVPQLEPILKETYGVIVYQEQVMRIAGELANYSMAEADDLRKAMGKKIAAILAEHRERFLKGCRDNDIDAAKAEQLFDLIKKFGGYGFNKSHSAAYALIAYQTAYLKAHYPTAFLAALLTSEMHSIDGVVKYIAECRNHHTAVLPPDINASSNTFTVHGDAIRFGLVAVKNVGEGAIEAIIEERSNGPFESLFNFCERIDWRKVNKRVIESLIKCGAFDSLKTRRSQLMAALEDAIEYGQRVQKEQNDPQMGLFDMDAVENQSLNVPSLPEIMEWDEKQLLAYEKESLGFYITGHPLDQHAPLVKKYANTDALRIREDADGKVVRIGGIIRATRIQRTKRGDLMAFMTLEDAHDAIEIIVFPKAYATSRDLLEEDRAVFVQGKVQTEENGVKVIAETIIPIAKAEEIWTGCICLNLDLAQIHRDLLLELKSLLRQHPGSCPVYLCLNDPGKSEVTVAASDALKVQTDDGLLRAVKTMLGPQGIETVCTVATITDDKANGNGRRFRSS